MGNGGDRGGATKVTIGTQFLRSWGNGIHVVSVTQAGFEYRDKVYRSLSEIARLITVPIVPANILGPEEVNIAK